MKIIVCDGGKARRACELFVTVKYYNKISYSVVSHSDRSHMRLLSRKNSFETLKWSSVQVPRMIEETVTRKKHYQLLVSVRD